MVNGALSEFEDGGNEIGKRYSGKFILLMIGNIRKKTNMA